MYQLAWPILGLLVLFALPAAAQKKLPAAAAPTPNLDAEYLPKGFTGDNIAAVFRELLVHFADKDEYETTQQYQQRLSAGYEKYKNKIYFFRFKPPELPGVNDYDTYYYPTYDADNQALTVEVPSSGIGVYREVPIAGTVAASRYVARNRFGVGTTVTRYTGNLYRIDFKWEPREVKTHIKMPPGQAKVIAERISICFVGSPIYPEWSKDSKHIVVSRAPSGKEPTMDYPIEDLTRTHSINMKIHSIWFYDRVTRKVLAKVTQ
jgi:hypothetical protein